MRYQVRQHDGVVVAAFATLMDLRDFIALKKYENFCIYSGDKFIGDSILIISQPNPHSFMLENA